MQSSIVLRSGRNRKGAWGGISHRKQLWYGGHRNRREPPEAPIRIIEEQQNLGRAPAVGSYDPLETLLRGWSLEEQITEGGALPPDRRAGSTRAEQAARQDFSRPP